MAQQSLKPRPASTGNDFEVTHTFCEDCDPLGTVSFCGVDVSDEEIVDTEENICVVCDDLWESHDCSSDNYPL